LLTYLLANKILARLYISGNYGSPYMVVGHQPVGAPDAILVNGVLGELEELELVDIDIGDIAFIWGHPPGNGSLVAMEPVRPVEGNIATSTNGGNFKRARIVDSVARNFRTIRIHDGSDISATEGNTLWNRVH